jgi:hypothetical protein
MTIQNEQTAKEGLSRREMRNSVIYGRKHTVRSVVGNRLHRKDGNRDFHSLPKEFRGV